MQGVDHLIVIDGHPRLEATYVVPDDGVVGSQRDSACQTLRIWRIIKEQSTGVIYHLDLDPEILETGLVIDHELLLLWHGHCMPGSPGRAAVADGL